MARSKESVNTVVKSTEQQSKQTKKRAGIPLARVGLNNRQKRLREENRRIMANRRAKQKKVSDNGHFLLYFFYISHNLY